MVTVLFLGLDPTFSAPSWLNDKAQHVLAFAVFAFLAVGAWPEMPLRTNFLWLSGFAGGIELIQWTMGLGREADWIDFLAGVGAAAFVLLGISINRSFRVGASD
ncbi:hypothetical protein [Qipengyuania citrea]|uniref:hypothetical protein n=1 Tax=Qipengyuania citrea TaxID=225971 RepID=UPI003298D94E